MKVTKSNKLAVTKIDSLVNLVEKLKEINRFFFFECENELYPKSDCQYAFLAIRGHELVLEIVEHIKILREEAIRCLYLNSKNRSNVN